MLSARQLERNETQCKCSCLPSAIGRLSSAAQSTRLLTSPQWGGCACGDSQWTLVWAQTGSLLLGREP